jgi:hypothetical protein
MIATAGLGFAKRTGFLRTERTLSMQRILRKSMPFVVAILIGTLAGVAVAGVALFAAHL